MIKDKTQKEVFYQCYQKCEYAFVQITKHMFGAKLEIKNGLRLSEKCKDGGLIFCNGQVYGYALFKKGYLLFSGTNTDIFGCHVFKEYKPQNPISTFRTSFIAFTQENINEAIKKVK